MSKPARTYRQQLDLLEDRGLIVADEDFAIHVLQHHNYYRLSAYRFPFVEAGDRDRFLPGTTFTQLWDLYHFDRSLRQLILEACKRVEISARSRWAYEIGHSLGPLSYIETNNFSRPEIHAETLKKLREEMDRSKEEYIRHHREDLSMLWPPAWVIAEVASFGNTSTLIGQLRDPSVRQAIADSYQLDEKTFCSLLHHLCVLRNTAAHHSLLWNRKFAVSFKLPKKKPEHLFLNFSTAQGSGNTRRIHNSLILLIHLVRCIEPTAHWPTRLLCTIKTLDPGLLPQMGFPDDWQTRPIWQSLLSQQK